MENIRALVTAAVKTGVTVTVAALVAWLLSLGIDIGEAAVALETGLFVGMTAVTNFLINAASQKWTWLAQVFSLGLSTGAPAYADKSGSQVATPAGSTSPS